MHVCGVCGGNAKEISEAYDQEHALAEHGEEEVLLVLLGVNV